MVNFLLPFIADINALTDNGETSLYLAVLCQRIQIVTTLLQAKADPNLTSDKQNFTPLLHSINEVATDDMDTSVKEIFNRISLDLIDHGADVNQQSRKEGFTALHLALHTRNLSILKAIIDTHEANLALKDVQGNTALHLLPTFPFDKRTKSQEELERDIAEYFLSHINRIDYQNARGETVLHTSVIYDNIYLVNLFINNDFWFKQERVLSIRDKKGHTVFHTVVDFQRIEILKLLLRVASSYDLAIIDQNVQTALQKSEAYLVQQRGISNRVLTVNANLRTINHHRSAFLIEYWVFVGWKKGLPPGSNPYQDPHFIRFKDYGLLKISEIIKSLQAILSLIKRLPLRSLKLKQTFFKKYRHNIQIILHDLEKIQHRFATLDSNIAELETLYQLVLRAVDSQIKTQVEEMSTAMSRYQKSLTLYHKNLLEMESLLKQEDFLSWKAQQLALPTSFPEYAHSLSERELQSNAPQSNEDKRRHRIAEDFHLQSEQYARDDELGDAIDRLKEAIQQEETCTVKNKLKLACWRYRLAEFYFKQRSFEDAKNTLIQAIATFSHLQFYIDLQEASQLLATISIYANTSADFEREYLYVLYTVSESTHEQKLVAHLSLAGLYKEWRRISRNLDGPSLYRLQLLESFHYSKAYKFTQGRLDSDAHIVLQQEIGITNNEKIGSYNIQQCVVVVAHAPQTGTVVLSHFDRFTGPIMFIKKLVESFSETEEIHIYLTGGRDRDNGYKEISDNNINLVLRQLYLFSDRFVIESADLGDKPSPPGIIFDPHAQPPRLLHGTPDRSRADLTKRAIYMSESLMKEYVRPPRLIDFTLATKSYTFSSDIDITEQYAKRSKLINNNSKLYLNLLWNHNQLLYPLLKELYGSDSFESSVIFPFFRDRVDINSIVREVLDLKINDINDVQQYEARLNYDISQLHELHLQSLQQIQSSSSSDFQFEFQATPFERAMNKGDFQHWLTATDIAAITRVKFGNFRTSTQRGQFDIVGDEDQQLFITLRDFKTQAQSSLISNERLTLIVNLSRDHWVTLVVCYQNGQFNAFYVNSLARVVNALPQSVFRPLSTLDIAITDLSYISQTDGYNCAIWALENALLINHLLDTEGLFNRARWIAEQARIRPDRTPEYFIAQRTHYAELLRRERQILQLQAALSHCLGARQKRSHNCFFSMQLLNENEKTALHSNRLFESPLTLLEKAKAWQKSLTSLQTLLKAGWLPVLSTVERIDENNEQVQLIHRITHEQHKENLYGTASWQFTKELQAIFQRLKTMLTVMKFIVQHPEKALQILFNFSQDESLMGYSMSEVEATNTLNFAFTLQTLFNFFQYPSRQLLIEDQEGLSRAIEIHLYVNIAQMVHGTALDAERVLSLVKTLLHQENLLQKPVSSFMRSFKLFVNNGLGMSLQILAVGLDIYELNEARTEAQKNLLASYLAFDVMGLGITGAMLLGAETLGISGAIGSGYLAVPLIGLQIGTLGLVNTFNEVVNHAQAVGKYFWQLDYAYQHNGYEIHSQNGADIMVPLAGAVISCIDFQNKRIDYDSALIYPSIQQTHGFNMPIYIKDKNRAINIRERLGYSETFTLPADAQTVKAWVLLSTAKVYLAYTWTYLPFATTRHDQGFDVLRRLEGDDFFYDFYHFPSEYIITQLYEEVANTAVKVMLDEEPREFFIAKFSSANFPRSYLSYSFEATTHQGSCFVALNPVSRIELRAPSGYQWILSAKDLGDDRLHFSENGIEIGTIQIRIETYASNVFFIDKIGNYFQLDFIRRILQPQSLSFTFLKQQHVTIQTYLANHHVRANHTMTLIDYPMLNDKAVSYLGTAFYLPEENIYRFMEGMPQQIAKAMIMIYSKNISFFYHPNIAVIWQTGKENYVQKAYMLFNHLKDFDCCHITFNGIVNVVVDHAQGLTIVQKLVFKDFSIPDENQQGLLYYRLMPEKQKLTLYAIRDVSAQFVQNYLLKDLKISRLQPAEIDPQFLGDYSIDRIVIKQTQFASTITLFTHADETNRYFSLFLVQNEESRSYALIDPKLQQEIFYVGGLTAYSGQTIHYFFQPKTPTNAARLFQQQQSDTPASLIEIAIVYPITINDNYLFFLMEGGLIQARNNEGNLYLVSITADWLKNHSNWTVQIPHYLRNHTALTTSIPINGITDSEGRSVRGWYDTQPHLFVFASMNNGAECDLNYLGQLQNSSYFFCVQQKTLFKQFGIQPLVSNATQLQTVLPELTFVINDIAQANLLRDTIWINTGSGLLLSRDIESDSRAGNVWLLKKITYAWFSHHASCLQEYVSSFSLRNRTLSQCALSTFAFNESYAQNTTQNTFLTDGNTLIPIEEQPNRTTVFWRPVQDSFYRVPAPKDGSQWYYLGGALGSRVAYFFSAEEKLTYVIANDFQSERYEMFPTDFALRMQNAILLIINLNNDSFLFPVLEEVKFFTLDVTSPRLFKLQISEEAIRNYQSIIYQFNSSTSENLLELPESTGNYFAIKQGIDLLILNTNHSCQIILAEAMRHDSAFQYTSINLCHVYANGTETFFHQRLAGIRSQLLTIFEARNKTAERFMPLIPSLWLNTGEYKNSSFIFHSQKLVMEEANAISTLSHESNKPWYVKTGGLLISGAMALTSITIGAGFYLFRRYKRPAPYLAVPFIEMGSVKAEKMEENNREQFNIINENVSERAYPWLGKELQTLVLDEEILLNKKNSHSYYSYTDINAQLVLANYLIRFFKRGKEEEMLNDSSYKNSQSNKANSSLFFSKPDSLAVNDNDYAKNDTTTIKLLNSYARVD